LCSSPVPRAGAGMELKPTPNPFLADGVRRDGRVLRERRRARLQRSVFASTHGSASVRLGESAAVAGVSAQVTEVVPELPPHGQIVVGVELPPLCSSVFRDRSRTWALSTFLSSSLTEILNSSNVFNPEQLDIKEGQLFWAVQVHVVCLNYDGNAFDLCLLTALAALEDVCLPALVEDPAEPTTRLVTAPPETPDVVSEARRLSLKSRPLPVSFAQLPGERWVVDPAAFEEELGGAAVSLCLVGDRWLVYHHGGANADRFLGELMPAARACVPGLLQLLDEPGDTSKEAGQTKSMVAGAAA